MSPQADPPLGRLCLPVPDVADDGEEDGGAARPPTPVTLPEELPVAHLEAHELGPQWADLYPDASVACDVMCIHVSPPSRYPIMDDVRHDDAGVMDGEAL